MFNVIHKRIFALSGLFDFHKALNNILVEEEDFASSLLRDLAENSPEESREYHCQSSQSTKITKSKFSNRELNSKCPHPLSFFYNEFSKTKQKYTKYLM